MRIEISQEPITPATLTAYAQVPIAYEVNQILAVESDKSGSYILSKRPLGVPYIKDYDAIKGEGPLSWAQRFDLSNWALFVAHLRGSRVGGAAVAYKTCGLDMLEGRDDLAVLWDLRVSSEAKGQGIGSALFQAAEKWALSRGCTQLKIETQNVNLPACMFYQAQGCVIKEVHHHVYSDFPDEIQLLWYRDFPQNRKTLRE